MDFMNAMKNELNKRKTFTANGAVAYATSGKALLDFNFAVSALRQAPEPQIEEMFTKAYFEDPVTAIKFLFWLRDCRGGNGERRIFRVCMKSLANGNPKLVKAVMSLIPVYGRWDDLWCLLDTGVKDKVVDLVTDQWKDDIYDADNHSNTSLLFKWLPSSNTSSRETRRYADIIMKGLGMTPAHYRKTLSKMRKYLDVVERKMSAKEWSDIIYDTVPSQANLKYKNAFLRNDEGRRRAYLEALAKGEAKINAGTLAPHEIVSKYVYGIYDEPDEALEQLWKALPVYTLDNTLVIRDGSGSMGWGYHGNVRPLDVATALAIYMADHNGGIWKGKFITFSSRPSIVDLTNCESLQDKLRLTYAENDYSNTDIEKTMMLILNTARKNHCKQADMPKNIVIVSDMQFDALGSQSRDKSLFDEIADRFEEAGYLMPKICFWNVAGCVDSTIPMQENELGVVLASGFNAQIMKMFMSGETDPYKALLDVINTERYQPVEDAIINM